MIVANTVNQLHKALESYFGSVGFVPTMGALHDGHVSLVKEANRKSDVTVVSIFVNPTQFNDKKDLDRYPRTLEEDLIILKKEGVDIIFTPSVKDIYPDGDDYSVQINLKGMDKVMEGAFRPGHFDGVIQVVKRLLDIVNPHHLYMGQKDFQQFTIIQHMIHTLAMKVELVVCPIKREPNGLARSSRNERLKKDVREKASIIYRILQSIKRRFKYRSFEYLASYAEKRLSKGAFELEYISFVDGNTLQPVSSADETDYLVCCIVVWAYNDSEYKDGVRLIDNIILKKNKK